VDGDLNRSSIIVAVAAKGRNIVKRHSGWRSMRGYIDSAYHPVYTCLCKQACAAGQSEPVAASEEKTGGVEAIDILVGVQWAGTA